MRKNDQIHIKISTEEKNTLKKRANSTGLELSSYCRFILLKAEPKIEYNTNDT